MTWTPFEPRLIDGQRRPWGIAHLIDGVPHFHKIDGRIARYGFEETAQLAADVLNVKVAEHFRNYMDGIEPPEKASHGLLRWPVQLVDYPVDNGHSFINIGRPQHVGKDSLSLTGIPWTLSATDAQIVASALVNAARWLDRHPNPYLAERD